MTAKDLERLISARGGSASALDQVTRKLRSATRVSTAGRGFNAHALTTEETAWILIGYAGAAVAQGAAHAVLLYSDFLRPNYFQEPGISLSNSFFAAFAELLQMPRALHMIDEIRFGRNVGLVSIVLKNGKRISYCPSHADLDEVEATAARSFISAGILTGGLLLDVAHALGGDIGEQVG